MPSSITPTKTALITGITGQDGSYLAELLLDKEYEVHGIKRRASSFNTTRIDHLYQDPHVDDPRLVLHYGDLTDSRNLIRIIQQVQPDEIYNLGAQSHVAVSFEAPEYTANSDALGTLRILEAVRMFGLTEKTRIYQASTSELYGLVQEIPPASLWEMDFSITVGSLQIPSVDDLTSGRALLGPGLRDAVMCSCSIWANRFASKTWPNRCFGSAACRCVIPRPPAVR